MLEEQLRILPSVWKNLSSYKFMSSNFSFQKILLLTAAGRNRELQGLARAIVKLWETSALAKIAIKRGVPFTSNDRMAEVLKVYFS